VLTVTSAGRYCKLRAAEWGESRCPKNLEIEIPKGIKGREVVRLRTLANWKLFALVVDMLQLLLKTVKELRNFFSVFFSFCLHLLA